MTSHDIMLLKEIERNDGCPSEVSFETGCTICPIQKSGYRCLDQHLQLDIIARELLKIEKIKEIKKL